MRSTLVATAALCVFSVAAHASSFVYNVDNQFSSQFPMFSVIGTITTDKDSGILSSGDITDFNLTLTDPFSDIVVLTPATTDRVAVMGQSFSATPTGLFFDYTPSSGATSALYFEEPYPYDGLFYEAINVAGDPSSERIRVDGFDSIQDQTGVVEIATAVTPEPSSLALLGTGMLGLAGVVRRGFVS